MLSRSGPFHITKIKDSTRKIVSAAMTMLVARLVLLDPDIVTDGRKRRGKGSYISIIHSVYWSFYR